jgi:hypothetical protein
MSTSRTPMSTCSLPAGDDWVVRASVRLSPFFSHSSSDKLKVSDTLQQSVVSLVPMKQCAVIWKQQQHWSQMTNAMICTSTATKSGICQVRVPFL